MFTEMQLVGIIHDLVDSMPGCQIDVAIIDFNKAFDVAHHEIETRSLWH